MRSCTQRRSANRRRSLADPETPRPFEARFDYEQSCMNLETKVKQARKVGQGHKRGDGRRGIGGSGWAGFFEMIGRIGRSVIEPLRGEEVLDAVAR